MSLKLLLRAEFLEDNLIGRSFNYYHCYCFFFVLQYIIKNIIKYLNSFYSNGRLLKKWQGRTRDRLHVQELVLYAIHLLW